MSTMYAALLDPFYSYNMEVGKRKLVTSVVEHILKTSLKRPNDLQKFVLETCKHAATCMEYANGDINEVLQSDEKRLKFG